MAETPANADSEPRRCACVVDGVRCSIREGGRYALDDEGICWPCQKNHQSRLPAPATGGSRATEGD